MKKYNSDNYSSFWEIPANELREDIKSMENNDSLFLPCSDYGHGIIDKVDDKYKIYSIPEYGGEPQLEAITKDIDSAINTVGSWT